MPIQNNPLKQYFRRPAIYLRLPSGGKLYKQGVIDMPESGELPVYPMTAIDEITSKTPDALFNGTAVIEIIKSCVPNIRDPWAINSIDLDAILIAIRSASGGSEMTITSECPNCKNVADYGVNLAAVLSELRAADYESELNLHELSIKFRPLTYKEMNETGLKQMEIQRNFIAFESEKDEDVKRKKTQDALKAVTDLTMQTLCLTIMSIKTPTANVQEKEYILDFLLNCDKDTYTNIRDYNASLRSQAELKPLKLKCINCQHEYDQEFTLNVSDFFG